MDIKFQKYYFWNDSTIARCWIKDEASKWKTYFANRMTHIQRIPSKANWHHVRSFDNLADLSSRGCTVKGIAKSSLWWKVASWLWKDKEL